MCLLYPQELGDRQEGCDNRPARIGLRDTNFHDLMMLYLRYRMVVVASTL